MDGCERRGLSARSSVRELWLLDEEGRRIEASAIKMNKKADRKLEAVVAMFSRVLADKCEIVGEGLLYRKLRLRELAPINDITMLYDVENRFAAISYNMLIQTTVKAEEDRSYHFMLRMDGVVRVKGMRFEAENDGRTLDFRGQELLSSLNEPLILKKIRQLGLVNVSVKYQPEYGRWLVSLKSMAGSATWILMPPVMQVIMPQQPEIYGYVELLRMLLCVVGGDSDVSGAE